jgi:hypothetical protein
LERKERRAGGALSACGRAAELETDDDPIIEGIEFSSLVVAI